MECASIVAAPFELLLLLLLHTLRLLDKAARITLSLVRFGTAAALSSHNRLIIFQAHCLFDRVSTSCSLATRLALN